MGWCDESGKHEGWLQPVFNDGEFGTGSSNAAGIVFDAYTDRERVRAYSEIVAWRMACECGWTGPTVALADLPMQDVHQKWNEPTEECESSRFLPAWREHIRPDNAVLELERLADELAAIQARVEVEVQQARQAGASWSHIGRALGLTKQGAQQRYA